MTFWYDLGTFLIPVNQYILVQNIYRYFKIQVTNWPMNYVHIMLAMPFTEMNA